MSSRWYRRVSASPSSTSWSSSRAETHSWPSVTRQTRSQYSFVSASHTSRVKISERITRHTRSMNASEGKTSPETAAAMTAPYA